MIGVEKNQNTEMNIPSSVIKASKQIRTACNVLFFQKPLLDVRAEDGHLEELIKKIRDKYPFAREDVVHKVAENNNHPKLNYGDMYPNSFLTIARRSNCGTHFSVRL